MKKIISILLVIGILFSLTACKESDPNENRVIANYDEQGFYDIEPADVELLEYNAAPILDLLIDREALTAYDVVFKKDQKGKYTEASAEDFELRQLNALDVPKFYFDGPDGLPVYPEQFVQYCANDIYYYSVDSITSNSGTTASDDGKTMVFIGEDGLPLVYDADASTLEVLGDEEFDGRDYVDYGKGWMINFALSGDGKYLAFTSNRRTYSEGMTSQTDIWLHDMKSGEESILKQNVSIYSDLYFENGMVFFCNLDQESGVYNYVGIDPETRQEISVEWNKEYSYIENGCIVGIDKVYEIKEGRTTKFENKIDDKSNTGVLSLDRSSIASLYSIDERLYLNVTDLSNNSSIKYRLPEEFNKYFINFKLVGMDGNVIYLQTMSQNNDKSGTYTVYYTIDLTYILENK